MRAVEKNTERITFLHILNILATVLSSCFFLSLKINLHSYKILLTERFYQENSTIFFSATASKLNLHYAPDAMIYHEQLFIDENFK